MKTRVLTSSASASGIVPEYGGRPPRPSNFRYRFNLSGQQDENQLEWDAVSTDYVTTWYIESSDTYNDSGTWTLIDTQANTGAVNTYSIDSQVSNKWFRVRGWKDSVFGFYAGPVENRRSGRTVTVKGYFLDLNGDPVEDATIEINLDTSDTQVTLEGHQRIEITPEIITPEAKTGFWEIKLFSSNEFTGTPGYTFRFRGKNTLETSDAKLAPDGTSEDVWFDELADA